MATATTHDDHHGSHDDHWFLGNPAVKWLVAVWGSFVKSVEKLPFVNKHNSAYWAVLIALAVFSVLTVAVYYADVHLGKVIPGLAHIFDDQVTGVDLLVGLTIASIKAALVLLIFMHLNHEQNLIYQLAGLTAFVFVFMLFLCWFAFVSTPPGVHEDPPMQLGFSPYAVHAKYKHGYGDKKEGEGHGAAYGEAKDEHAEGADYPKEEAPADGEH